MKQNIISEEHYETVNLCLKMSCAFVLSECGVVDVSSSTKRTGEGQLPCVFPENDLANLEPFHPHDNVVNRCFINLRKPLKKPVMPTNKVPGVDGQLTEVEERCSATLVRTFMFQFSCMNHCLVRSESIPRSILFSTKRAHIRTVSLSNTGFHCRLVRIDPVRKMSSPMFSERNSLFE